MQKILRFAKVSIALLASAFGHFFTNVVTLMKYLISSLVAIFMFFFSINFDINPHYQETIFRGFITLRRMMTFQKQVTRVSLSRDVKQLNRQNKRLAQIENICKRLNDIQELKLGLKWTENNLGKGEKAGCKHFLLLP